jgi:hypothetical protein
LSDRSQLIAGIFELSTGDGFHVTPTSTLAGILTGLIDGTLIALIVLLGAYVAKRRRHAPVPHPVAEDQPRHRSTARSDRDRRR